VRPGDNVVFGAGWIVDKTGWCSNRDWRAYALLYLTAGTGAYRDDNGIDVPLVAGDLLILFPGLRHSYGPHQPGAWSEVWLGFSGPLFATIEADGLISRSHPVLHRGLDPELVARMDALVAAVDRAGGTSDAVLVARVHLLIAELATIGHVAVPASLVARACAALASDLRRAVDLPRLARRLGVGYDTLRRAFRSELGTTPGQWRLLRKIERAKQLIADGASLDAAAAASGFCDRFFLARQFRQVVGVPPGRWRTELLGAPLSSGGQARPDAAGRSCAADHPGAVGHSDAAGRRCPGRGRDRDAPGRRGRGGSADGRARP
jgi:AraC-like DNA-binding protein